MKKIFNKKLGLILFLFCIIPFFKPAGFNFSIEKPEEAIFLSPIENKKKQIIDLDTSKKIFDEQLKEARNNISKRLSLVSSLISETEALIKNSTITEAKFYNNKLNKLKDRKHKLQNLKETWATTEEIILEHQKLLESILDVYQKTNQQSNDTKLVYSLKELRDTQKKITDLTHKITTESFKKDWLQKQKKLEDETIAAAQKEIELKKKEQKKILEKNLTIKTGEETSSTKEIKQLAELLEIDINMLNEKKENAEISNIKLDLEIKKKDDEIKLLELQLEEQKENLITIQARLYIDKADIEELLQNLNKAKQESLEIVNNLNKEREHKKFEKENYRLMASLLQDEKKAKPDITKLTDARSYLISSQYESAEAKSLALDKEIDKIDADRFLEDDKIALKELNYKIIDILFALQTNKLKKSELKKHIDEFSKNIKKEEYAKNSLEEKRVDISNFLTEAKLKSDQIQNTIDSLKSKKDSIFKGKESLYDETINAYLEALSNISTQRFFGQEIFVSNTELMKYKNDLLDQYKFILAELEAQKSFNIWKRSSDAISFDNLLKSTDELEEFTKAFLINIPSLLNPTTFINIIRQQKAINYLGWLILLLTFLFSLFLFKKITKILYTSSNKIKIISKRYILLLITLFKAITTICYKYQNSIFIWLFLFLDITFEFKAIIAKWLIFPSYTDSNYLKICFYIFSIPFLLFLIDKLIKKFFSLNEENNFSLIQKNNIQTYNLILKTFFYSTACLLSLQKATLFFVEKASSLPNLILAVYFLTLIIPIILPLFIHQAYIKSLVNFRGTIGIWITKFFNQYYYSILIFLILLLILINPFIGYYDLSILLIYSLPLTIATFYIIFFIHSYIRNNSACWFIKEEDDEIIDRFEHAKIYYGLFIILTFLSLLIISLIFVAKIWGFDTPFESIWELLKNKWTVPIGEGDDKFGIIQIFIFSMFIAGGYIFSTLLDKFVFTKFFDILKMDIGIRNTISSITHYTIIYLVVIIGMVYIHLGSFVKWISAAAVVGIGFALKDLLTDLVAGFLVLIERPLEIGNYIQMDDIEGTVKRITPRTTTIKNGLQRTIIIPNRDIISKPIINWTYARADIGFEIEVVVGYQEDPDFVKKILLTILHEDNRLLKSPFPIIRIENFEDSGYKFLVRTFISVRRIKEKWEIAADIRSNILKEFRKNNISIPAPQREIKILNPDIKK